jgi:hypothetical protein
LARYGLRRDRQPFLRQRPPGHRARRTGRADRARGGGRGRRRRVDVDGADGRQQG